MIARRLAVALTAIALATVALAGCSLPGSGGPGGNAGDDPAVSGPADGGGDGGGDGAGDPNAQVPASFPSDIPLIDGDVLEASDLGTGWVVLFGVDDAIVSFDDGADALAAAGFTQDARSTNATEGFAQYSNELYAVQISAKTDYPGYGQAVAYTVVGRG